MCHELYSTVSTCIREPIKMQEYTLTQQLEAFFVPFGCSVSNVVSGVKLFHFRPQPLCALNAKWQRQIARR